MNTTFNFPLFANAFFSFAASLSVDTLTHTDQKYRYPVEVNLLRGTRTIAISSLILLVSCLSCSQDEMIWT